MATERILVIDDSEEIRTILRDLILGPNGYEVLTAPDGQAGLELALSEHPDLILTDVNMPRMTGLQLLEQLREVEYEGPVVLMTFHGSENVAVQAFRLGVRDYLRKPLEFEEVLACVQRALVESRLRRERQELLERLEATNRQLSRKVTDLTTLYAVGQAVTSLLDPAKLLSRVVEASVYLCRSEEGALYLIDKESGELRLTAMKGIEDKVAGGLNLRVNDTLVGQVVRTGKPMAVASRNTDPELQVKTGYLVHSLLNVPLRVKAEIIGVLSVANRVRRRSFTREDLDRLLALGNYAAIAIENARLYQATRKVAAAEMLNNTVVTVSHYVNNPLMSLLVNVDRLAQAKHEGTISDPKDLVPEVTRFTETKVEEISSVLAILSDLASPQFVTYMDNIKMLDIEAKVKERLRTINEKHKG